MVRLHQQPTDPDDPTRKPWYRPDDPAWAPAGMAQRVREMLASIDPRLNIFWYPRAGGDDKEHPGRWGIVYWMNRAQCWSIVERWTGPTGEYRELSVESIKEFVMRFQIEADKLAKRCEWENHRRQQEEEAEIAERTREYLAGPLSNQMRMRPVSKQRRLHRTHNKLDDIG